MSEGHFLPRRVGGTQNNYESTYVKQNILLAPVGTYYCTREVQ
jgi:hypothetical protein